MPPLCDFCSAPKPGWKYPARSFIGYEACGVAGESVGDWAACEECHQLIASGNRVGLTERSVVTFIEPTGFGGIPGRGNGGVDGPS